MCACACVCVRAAAAGHGPLSAAPSFCLSANVERNKTNKRKIEEKCILLILHREAVPPSLPFLPPLPSLPAVCVHSPQKETHTHRQREKAKRDGKEEGGDKHTKTNQKKEREVKEEDIDPDT